MRQVKKKPYQEYTFALRIPFELYDDGLVCLKLETPFLTVLAW
jgi:hypothetical protein